MKSEEIINHLTAKGLKVTPQRIAIYRSLLKFCPHPSKEQVIEDVHKEHPYISVATIYNVLDSFVEKNIITKMKTDKDSMHFELCDVMPHHHIYCSKSGQIMDYFNDEVDVFLKDFFAKNPIADFDISDIRLQINGNYKNNK